MVDGSLLVFQQFLQCAAMHKDEQVINGFEVFDTGVAQLEFLTWLYGVCCDMKQEMSLDN